MTNFDHLLAELAAVEDKSGLNFAIESYDDGNDDPRIVLRLPEDGSGNLYIAPQVIRILSTEECYAVLDPEAHSLVVRAGSSG